MASKEPTFPTTEAWRQSIEILSKASADDFAVLLADVGAERIDAAPKGASSSVGSPEKQVGKKDKKARESSKLENLELLRAIANFTLDQLTYQVTAVEDINAALLAPFEGTPLSQGHVEAVKTYWGGQGKAIVGAARKQCAAMLCGPDLNFISARPYVKVHEGACDEVEVDEEGHDGEVDLVVSSKPPGHKTLIAVELPPVTASENSPGGGPSAAPTLQLDLKQTYELFTEIDAIQARLDELNQ